VPRGRAGLVTQAKQITSGNRVIEGFDISPDGEWLAFDSDRSGNSDLYRMRLDGKGEPEQLTRSPVSEFFPVWSPDGKEIAFHSFREGRRQIYSMPSEGGAVVPVAQTEQDDRVPIWMPDGNAILFMSNAASPSNETRLVTRLSNGSWSPPTRWKKPACVPVWSPDGKRAVCLTIPGQLLLTDRKGDSLRVLTDRSSIPGTIRSAAWSSNGGTVYFLSADSTGINVYSVPASGGSARIAVRFDDPRRPWHRYGFEVFRDRFYFTVGDQQSDIWVADVRRP
jgi:Tol biopolymer transport system component